MRRADESGAGVLGTLIGAGVFVLLLLFAVQVLVGLYTASVVNAATYDAAKFVAGSDGGEAAVADAEANARSQLGGYGRRVTFDWSEATSDVIRVVVTGPRPSFLPAALTGPAGLGDIRREVTVRREKVR